MGPNGDTPSWSLSHEPSDGAFGGLLGFHGTVVLLTIDFLSSPFFWATGFSSALVLGNSGNDTGDPLIGPRSRFAVYADCEGTAVVAACSETGNFGSGK